MVSVIGVMVGLYIMTRCGSMVESKDEGVIVKGMAGITFFVSVLCTLYLFVGPGVVTPAVLR